MIYNNAGLSNKRWQYIQAAPSVMLFRRLSQPFLYLEVLSYLCYHIRNKGEHNFSEVIGDFAAILCTFV